VQASRGEYLAHGVQHAALNYPGLNSTIMFEPVDEFFHFLRERKREQR
jgi:hypothetical protein